MGAADSAAAGRGLERLRIEVVTTGRISPDSCMALLTILGFIDTGYRVLTVEPDGSEIVAATRPPPQRPGYRFREPAPGSHVEVAAQALPRRCLAPF